jgi:Flp pilus assembly protein TadD
LLQSLGWHQHLDGQTGEAIATLRRALEIDPGRRKSAHNLAILLHKEGQLDAAREVAVRLTEVHRLYPDGWNARGAIHLDLQELDAAAQTLGEALRLAPSHAGALANLGGVAFLQGDHAAAKAHWQAAVRAGSTRPMVIKGLRHLASIPERDGADD